MHTRTSNSMFPEQNDPCSVREYTIYTARRSIKRGWAPGRVQRRMKHGRPTSQPFDCFQFRKIRSCAYFPVISLTDCLKLQCPGSKWSWNILRRYFLGLQYHFSTYAVQAAVLCGSLYDEDVSTFTWRENRRKPQTYREYREGTVFMAIRS